MDAIFNILPYDFKRIKGIFEYQEPKGYLPLVRLLEEKHKAPVVIFNGAKQALCGSFNSIKKIGKQKLGLRIPFWCLLKPIIEMNGLEISHSNDFDSYLCVAPDNPDGYLPTIEKLKEHAEDCKDRNIPFIHDCVYFNKIYLPNNYPIFPVGDIQIFSFSKSLGLSGIRCGYAVCHNTQFYNLLQEYVEATTVGASTLSQIFLYDLLNRMNGYPSLTQKFETISAAALLNSKKIVKQINPEILEVPDNIEDIAGMFLWAKIGPKADFNKAKVNPAYGEPFGAPGYVRINLALPEDQMIEIVKRLNSVL